MLVLSPRSPHFGWSMIFYVSLGITLANCLEAYPCLLELLFLNASGSRKTRELKPHGEKTFCVGMGKLWCNCAPQPSIALGSAWMGMKANILPKIAPAMVLWSFLQSCLLFVPDLFWNLIVSYNSVFCACFLGNPNKDNYKGNYKDKYIEIIIEHFLWRNIKDCFHMLIWLSNYSNFSHLITSPKTWYILRSG